MLDLNAQLRRGAFRLDARLAAPRGVTALFGPSGAGKTTLAHVLAGLVKPDNGHIELDGRVLLDTSTGLNVPARERRIGCVFQDARLFPHMTTEGNLRFAEARARGRRPVLSWREAVDLFELGGLLSRRPDGLSGGERQRVALARALLSAPKLLILDEPLASLDQRRRKRLVGYLRRLRDHLELPLIYITHEPREIARFADAAVLISEGRVIESGDAVDILSSQSFLSMTGDPDPWSVLSPVVREHTDDGRTHLDLEGHVFTLQRIDAEAGEVVRLVIRGRDLILASDDSPALSIRNAFPVEVLAVEPLDDHRRVVLSLGGARLSVRLRATVAEALKLRPGLRLLTLIRSVAFEGRNLEPENRPRGESPL